jgi:hypothetical protein
VHRTREPAFGGQNTSGQNSGNPAKEHPKRPA